MNGKFNSKTIVIIISLCFIAAVTAFSIIKNKRKSGSGHPVQKGNSIVLEDGTVIKQEDVYDYIMGFLGHTIKAETLDDIQEYKKEHPVKNRDRKVDIDMTKLNDTMAWSLFTRFFTSPEEYQGKLIKISGTLRSYSRSDKGEYYTSVLVDDAAGCCSSAMDFRLCDWYIYPDDYPFNCNNITVEGTLVSYSDGSDTYTFLADAFLTE